MADKFEFSEKTFVNGKMFTCVNCGCHCLEEIQVNITVSTTINKIDLDEDVEYGNSVENHGGDLQRIQCWNCGKILAEEDNSPEGMFKEVEKKSKDW